MRPMIDYFRANPQVLLLILICLVLGVGTFFAVIVSLIGAGHGSHSADPYDWVVPGRGLVAGLLGV